MADQQERKYTYKLTDPDDIKKVVATEYLIQDFSRHNRDVGLSMRFFDYIAIGIVVVALAMALGLRQ